MRAWNKQQLLAYLERVTPRLDTLSYFEMLDVAVDATEVQIGDAFHKMAERLHPDMFRLVLSPAEMERLTVVYGRLAEAYRTLRHPDDRRLYTQNLARELGEDATVGGNTAAALDLLPPRARALYQKAMAARRRGDRVSATLNMKMALATAPNSQFLKDVLAELK